MCWSNKIYFTQNLNFKKFKLVFGVTNKHTILCLQGIMGDRVENGAREILRSGADSAINVFFSFYIFCSLKIRNNVEFRYFGRMKEFLVLALAMGRNFFCVSECLDFHVEGFYITEILGAMNIGGYNAKRNDTKRN